MYLNLVMFTSGDRSMLSISREFKTSGSQISSLPAKLESLEERY